MTLRRVAVTALVVLVAGCVRSPTDPPPDSDDDGQIPDDSGPTSYVEPVSAPSAPFGILS